MNISSISGENNVSTPSTSSAASGGSERDMFMTLLVAQLKNQDPLAPQDGAAFVAQLAQFNSLDQLVGIRQSMDQLIAAMQQGQGSTASDQTK
jgi:flagellar basal-body rod modification protein FlgD